MPSDNDDLTPRQDRDDEHEPGRSRDMQGGRDRDRTGGRGPRDRGSDGRTRSRKRGGMKPPEDAPDVDDDGPRSRADVGFAGSGDEGNEEAGRVRSGRRADGPTRRDDEGDQRRQDRSRSSSRRWQGRANAAHEDDSSDAEADAPRRDRGRSGRSTRQDDEDPKGRSGRRRTGRQRPEADEDAEAKGGDAEEEKGGDANHDDQGNAQRGTIQANLRDLGQRISSPFGRKSTKLPDRAGDQDDAEQSGGGGGSSGLFGLMRDIHSGSGRQAGRGTTGRDGDEEGPASKTSRDKDGAGGIPVSGSASGSSALPHPSHSVIRRPPTVHDVRAARNVEKRVAPSRSPEVHFIGEVCGGEGFGPGVACRWRIEQGKYWAVLEGSDMGHSQTAYAPPFGLAVWNHPIDVHYQTTSMQGWPKIVVQIERLDEFNHVHTIGYGFAALPMACGCHSVSIPCWRPTGTQDEELRAFFLGTSPFLLDDDVVYHKASTHRSRLVTVPAGKVHLEINVLTRHFDYYGVDS